jgi:hypothetical protein
MRCGGWAARWDVEGVKDRVKNLVSLLLNRWEDREGRPVFSRGRGRCSPFGTYAE